MYIFKYKNDIWAFNYSPEKILIYLTGFMSLNNDKDAIVVEIHRLKFEF